jgi:hypothetical protein
MRDPNARRALSGLSVSPWKISTQGIHSLSHPLWEVTDGGREVVGSPVRRCSKKDVEIEVTSKPIADYQNDEVFELDLPVATDVMVGDEIVVESCNVAQAKVFCRCLGMPEPEPEKKGIFGRLIWNMMFTLHLVKFHSTK